MKQAEGWQGAAVLDVGCGGGYMCDALARLGARMTGLDTAQGALDAARRRALETGLTLHLARGRGAALPFQDHSFDRVICTDVLVHVPDPVAVICEIARVLRPGGLLFFSAIHRSWLSSLVMISVAEDLMGLVHAGTHDPAKFIRREELRRWCANADLHVQDVQGIGPVAWRGGLIFGRLPVTWVMYQGYAMKSP